MTIALEQAVTVAAPPETVWHLLVDVPAWKTWWPDCLDAHTRDHKSLREGSDLEVLLQPKQQKLTLRPFVDLYTESRTLSLTHLSFSLAGTVTWQLQPGPTGTRVTGRMVLQGLLPFFLKLFRQDDIARFILHANLRGLKKMAERMG